MTTLPGIRESVYVEGFNFTAGPTTVTLSQDVGETRNRARNGKLLVHRAAPFAGCCERITKLTLALSWQTLRGPDIDIINDMIAFGGPLDVCLWRPITESFLGGSGTLARRNAVAVIAGGLLPPYAATLYALVGIRAGAPDTVYLGTINADYRTPWTSAGSSGRIFIRYYPVVRAYVAEGQPLFTANNIQGQTLSFEEM